jgi:CHASE3 domain sensor protein
LVSDERARQQQFNYLESVAAERLALIEKTIALRESKGFAAARQEILTNEGKKTMDNIRQIVEKLKAERQQLLQQRTICFEYLHQTDRGARVLFLSTDSCS